MKKFLFLGLLLISIHFWQIRFIPQIYNAESLLFWLLTGACLLMVFTNKELHFKNAIFFFFFGVLINTMSAWVNHGQSPKDTILAFSPYYFILFYFFLHQMKMEVKYIEKIVIIFAAIYSALYIAQMIALPYIIVNAPIDASRGTIRLRIEGNGFLMLAYFFLLNRFIIKRKLIDLVAAVIFFIILFLGGFRTLAAAALLLSFFMFIRLTTFSIKDYLMLIFVAVLFVGLFQVEGIQRIFSSMIESTQDVIDSGQDYIRLQELEFFYKMFPKNASVFFFGSGLPGGYSPYYLQIASYGWNMGYFWSDIGLLGLFVMIGPFALGGILWYTFKAIFIKLPKDKFYLKMYFAYLVLVSFTTMEIFREGIFSVQAIGLYLIDCALNEKNNPVIGSNESIVR